MNRRIPLTIRIMAAVTVALAMSTEAPAEDYILINAGAIHLGNGEIILNGSVLVRDGRIERVGTKLKVAGGGLVIHMPEGSVTPGLIDANAALEPEDLLTEAPRSANAVLHGFFCPRHTDKPVMGCCGSTCSNALQHVSGERCKECGFPDTADAADTAVGTRWRATQAEQVSEVVPHTRVIDAVNLRSPDMDRLLSGGVTTVFVSPESASVISSRGAVVRTGGPIGDRVVRPADAVMASMGTDPSWRGRGNRPPFRNYVSINTRRPTTRMGVTWVFRKALYDTARQRQGLPIVGADAPSPEAMGVLGQVLAGQIPLRIQARTQHDITSALRLADEFSLPFVLEEATEAHLMLKELVASKTPVIYGPIYMSPSGYRAYSSEVDRARLSTFKALIDSGVETALTAHELRDEDGLARQAMYAMRYGLSLADVTRSVTQVPARMLGLDDELGTVEAGKRADLLVWNGKPFEATSSPVVVLVGGEVVLDRR